MFISSFAPLLILIAQAVVAQNVPPAQPNVPATPNTPQTPVNPNTPVNPTTPNTPTTQNPPPPNPNNPGNPANPIDLPSYNATQPTPKFFAKACPNMYLPISERDFVVLFSKDHKVDQAILANLSTEVNQVLCRDHTDDFLFCDLMSCTGSSVGHNCKVLNAETGYADENSQPINNVPCSQSYYLSANASEAGQNLCGAPNNKSYSCTQYSGASNCQSCASIYDPAFQDNTQPQKVHQ